MKSIEWPVGLLDLFSCQRFGVRAVGLLRWLPSRRRRTAGILHRRVHGRIRHGGRVRTARIFRPHGLFQGPRGAPERVPRGGAQARPHGHARRRGIPHPGKSYFMLLLFH